MTKCYMDMLDFLAQDEYIAYNKTLAKKIGINETILFMYFVGQFKWFTRNNQLTEDGYFYKIAEDIYENTGLSRYQQKAAMDKLREMGLIDYKPKGVPARLHFRIFADASLKLLEVPVQTTVLKKLENKVSSNLKTSIEETEKQDLKKLENIYIDNTNIINKKNKKDTRIHFGEFVLMEKEEHQKLINIYGEKNTNKYITNLDNYLGSKGKKYKSHYRTILVRMGRDGVKPFQEKPKIEAKQATEMTTEQKEMATAMLTQARDTILSKKV